MSIDSLESSKRVLETYDRVSEVLFGLIMALTFTGLLSVANSCRIRKQDWLGAISVCFLVVLSTFPVAIPFIFIEEVALAMRISNGIAIAHGG